MAAIAYMKFSDKEPYLSNVVMHTVRH